MKTKKRTYNGRNTGMFYALLGQLPGFDRRYQDVIKEGVVNEFLEREHGKHHGIELKISKLSDMEYRHLIQWMRGQVADAKTKEKYQEEATRKGLINQILKTFTRIKVYAAGNWDDVNFHVRRIPYSKGRIIPQIPTDELPGLLGAVRGYCDNIKKKQIKEQQVALKN